MPRYFAQIDDTKTVERVIVADSLEWCVQHLGGTWVETFMDVPDKNYAGRGHKYRDDKDNFVSEKPYESFVLNEKLQWTAPVEKPVDGIHMWDEKNLAWKDVSVEKAEAEGVTK